MKKKRILGKADTTIVKENKLDRHVDGKKSNIYIQISINLLKNIPKTVPSNC